MGRGMGDMNYRHKAVMALGIVQIVIGVIIFGAGIAVVVKKSWVEEFYHGIWGGIWVITTGILGLLGGLMKKRGLEIAFLVLSILSACSLWLGLFIISFGGMVGDHFYAKQQAYEDFSDSEKTSCHADELVNLADGKEMHVGYRFCGNKPASTANLVIVAMSGLLFILAITSASFACCAVCACCGATNDNSVQPQHVEPMQHYGNEPPPPQGGYYA